MQIVESIDEMRRQCKRFTRGTMQETLGLVPTMGALHAGHLSLVLAATQSCDRVAATIFVNPLQFGPHEDLARYPRTFDADCEALERAGVDLLFAPSPAEMYPGGAQTVVDVPSLGARLDGASRPGHFRGVTTVVAKLFHIVQPDRAFFGQKDAAQVAILRAMVRDLNFDLELIVCPTVRDADGLALSSRNRYLSVAERTQALAIPQALRCAEQAALRGVLDAASLRQRMLEHLLSAEGLRVDYVEIVDPDALEPIHDVRRGALLAIAAWVGETRLIDNLLLPSRTLETS
jgi:pantoate--beta-alanine ligase